MRRRFLSRQIFTAALSASLASLWACSAVSAQTGLPTTPSADRAEARAIFKQLIEINTTDTPLGNVTTATAAMQKRFLDAGFPAADVQLLGPDARKQNLVVRFRASGAPTEKPVLFLCHMDVVEALPSDWSTDPFQFVEKDGYYYGRGTQDMKNSDAALVETFLRLHREGYKPRRDLILALTADEEGGKFNGAEWLVREHRDLVDAAYVINPDAGGVELDHGRAVVADVEATEKVYSDFQIMAINRGGHSSLPRPDNAIYELTAALSKLEAFTFLFEMNEVTRTYFKNLAQQETGQTRRISRQFWQHLQIWPLRRGLAMSQASTQTFVRPALRQGWLRGTPITRYRRRRRRSSIAGFFPATLRRRFANS